MITEKIYKYKNIILLTIGILLIIISFCLLAYDKLLLLKESVYNEVELLKYHEMNDNVETIEDEENIDEQLEIDDANTEELDEDSEIDEQETPKKENTVKKESTESKKAKEYIGYLEISKINLKLGILPKTSYYNNVNRNIEVLSASDYPDKDKGNTIIAGHSGTGYLAFFKNLYRLKLSDIAKIYYKGKIYTYKIVNIYNVPKIGYVSINRDIKKTCLTLITCTKDSKTEQTIYILELIKTESEAKV